LRRKPGLVVTAGWPEAAPPDAALAQAAAYLEATLASLRRGIAKAEAPPKAKKGAPGAPPAPPARVSGVELVVAARYGGWQAKTLELLASLYDPAGAAASPPAPFPGDLMARVLAAANADPEIRALGPKALKAGVMPFAKGKADAAAAAGPGALRAALAFDEGALLEDNAEYLARALRVQSVRVARVSYEEQSAEGAAPEVAGAAPGAPGARFATL
jgi:leucyl-tRNA synthetase